MFRRRSSHQKVGPVQTHLRQTSIKNALAADGIINNIDARTEESLLVAGTNTLFKSSHAGGDRRETKEESVSL